MGRPQDQGQVVPTSQLPQFCVDTGLPCVLEDFLFEGLVDVLGNDDGLGPESYTVVVYAFVVSHS